MSGEIIRFTTSLVRCCRLYRWQLHVNAVDYTFTISFYNLSSSLAHHHNFLIYSNGEVLSLNIYSIIPALPTMHTPTHNVWLHLKAYRSTLGPNLDKGIPTARTEGLSVWTDTHTRNLFFVRNRNAKGGGALFRQDIKGQQVTIRRTAKD
jgi:hypothetical protein